MNKDTEQPIQNQIYVKETKIMNENTTLKTNQQQKDHEITKINRQADVLDQTRLRPPIIHR